MMTHFLWYLDPLFLQEKNMYSHLISLCSCQILYMVFAVKWLLYYRLRHTHV